MKQEQAREDRQSSASGKVQLPPTSIKGARKNCDDCKGDGRIIVTFVRRVEPRIGYQDYDVVPCQCIYKKEP